MQGYVGAIEDLTKANSDFRRVIFTAPHLQLVLMALKPGEEIGSEVHSTHDQFFRIEKGKGQIRIGGARIMVAAGDAIIVPAGVRHNLTNTGKRRMRLYTIYAPPNHADQLIEPTKAVAMAHEQARDAARSPAAVAEQSRNDMIDEGSPVRQPGR